MISIIVDHDNDRVILTGTDSLDNQILETYECNMQMSDIQKMLLGILNAVTPSENVNFYRRNEGADRIIESW